jgi:hypothetical protein
LQKPALEEARFVLFNVFLLVFEKLLLLPPLKLLPCRGNQVKKGNGVFLTVAGVYEIDHLIAL